MIMTRNVLMGRRTSTKAIPSIRVALSTKEIPSIKEENPSPKEEASKKVAKKISLTKGPLWTFFIR